MDKAAALLTMIENAPTDDEAVKQGYESQAQYIKMHTAFIDLLETIIDVQGIMRNYLLLDVIGKSSLLMATAICRDKPEDVQLRDKVLLIKSIISVAAAAMDMDFVPYDEAKSKDKDPEPEADDDNEKKTIH